MTVNQITAGLIRQGAQLRAEGDQLTIRVPKGAAIPQRERLAGQKRKYSPCCASSPQVRYLYSHFLLAKKLCGFFTSSRLTAVRL